MFVQRRFNRFKWLPGLLVAVMMLSGTGALLANWLDMPVVYKDALKGTCVGVDTPSGLQDCSMRPSRYDVVLVAPGTTYGDLAKRDK